LTFNLVQIKSFRFEILPGVPEIGACPGNENYFGNCTSATFCNGRADQILYNEMQAVIAPFPDVKATVDNGVVTLTSRITRPGPMLLMPKVAGLFPGKIEIKLVIK
jgi:hypothetical protein